MRALLINDNVKEQLKSLSDYAFKNQYSMDDLLDRKNGDMQPPGDDSNFVRMIPNGYKVVLSVEQQVAGLIRYASISVEGGIKNKVLPSLHACEQIIKMLGFEGEIHDCLINIDEPGAVAIIEKIK